MQRPFPHDSIFSPAVLSLGRIHWFLMKAAITIDDAYLSKAKDPGASASRAPTLIMPRGQRTPLAARGETEFHGRRHAHDEQGGRM
jgi:hypothetical protein